MRFSIARVPNFSSFHSFILSSSLQLMFPKLILFATLAGCVLAQGDDTIGSFIAENSTGVVAGVLAGVDFKFVWNGEQGHQLNNITIELISGAAEGVMFTLFRALINIICAVDKSNNVVDIVVANYSSTDKPTFTYVPHPGTPGGFYHGRLNGTASGSNSMISSLSNTFSLNGSANPCDAGTFTPITSLADAAYGPIRLFISSPNASLIFTQSDLSGPTGWIEISWSRIDTLFDLESESATVEVINNATGFNAGVQTPDVFGVESSGYITGNLTLDPGAWKMRMNVTTSSPLNPGTFSMSSDIFLVVANDSQPACPAAAVVNSPSGSTSGNTQPKTDSAAGCVLGGLSYWISYWIWLPVLFILF
ncbi:hypothetical protein DFH09DRAFT_1200997 [Mycena vulgaris]|nr:hypothetical protein DFH09DRAFT_1205672 [Mycena vulgaris]KAJ6504957.1 hypothetical protein DFH09DRAFT_1200997 [Mycena vulgaris]